MLALRVPKLSGRARGRAARATAGRDDSGQLSFDLARWAQSSRTWQSPWRQFRRGGRSSRNVLDPARRGNPPGWAEAGSNLAALPRSRESGRTGMAGHQGRAGQPDDAFPVRLEDWIGENAYPCLARRAELHSRLVQSLFRADPGIGQKAGDKLTRRDSVLHTGGAGSGIRAHGLPHRFRTKPRRPRISQ